MSKPWGSGNEDGLDETTPIMHPVRMELAPHARLGRRISAAIAIFALLVFQIALVVIGVVNYDSDCDAPLALLLIIYGGVGLLFVYLLAREWLYYARLSSLPTLTNLILLLLFYAALCTAGGFLTYYTYLTRETCLESAPLLYRWCKAAVLFFAIVLALFLVVPLVRGLARLLLAPCALCLISCVETVGVDVEVGALGNGEEAAVVAGASGGGGGGGGKGGVGSSAAQRQQAKAAATFTIVCCSPFYFILQPIQFCLKPLGNCAMALLTPIGLCLARLLQAGGCLEDDGGWIRFTNPLPTMYGAGGCLKGCAQVALAPGCVVPGRSLVALFVNTAALLWFFLYLAVSLYDSWEVVCASRNPGTAFQDDPWGWLTHGAPSPIHWLLLLFSVAGVLLVVISFIHDMFTGPSPPPRSHYEAQLWRGRRQVKVIGLVVLLMLFLGWGIALTYFTFLGDDCATTTATRDESLYNVALLLVLLMLCVVGVIVLLGCCVVLDCFLSGRLRCILLLSNPQPPPPPPPEQYAASGREGEERLVPGVPYRDSGTTGQTSYGTQSGAAAPLLVGATDETGSRMRCDAPNSSTRWARAGPPAAGSRA